MGRRPCCSGGDGLNRGAWTEDEDNILASYVNTHGVGKWRSLPKRAGLNRCGKSCRLRWLNYLRPDIKRGNISDEEEDLIIRLHKLLGNRWSLIAGRLPGRTDNEIKNYWNTTLAKKLSLRTKGKKPMSDGRSGPNTEKEEEEEEEEEEEATDKVRHTLLVTSHVERRQEIPKGNCNSHDLGLLLDSSTPKPNDVGPANPTSDVDVRMVQDASRFLGTSTGALVHGVEEESRDVDGATANLESLSMLSSLIQDDYWFDDAVMEDWLRKYDEYL